MTPADSIDFARQSIYVLLQISAPAMITALVVGLGIGLLHPEWWAKLLVIAGLILLTNPVGSSTIARALLISGVRPWRRAADDQNGGQS